MRTYSQSFLCGAMIAVTIAASSVWAAKPQPAEQPALTPAGEKLEAMYTRLHEQLRTELAAKLLKGSKENPGSLEEPISSDAMDDKLVRFVVLNEATPRGFALFAQQGNTEANLVEQLLKDADLMKQMLVADGPGRKRIGRDTGPSEFGPAMKIYSDIQKESKKASNGLMQRMAVAVSLAHSVPVTQTNPTADTNAPTTVDPVKRYLHFEKAYENGELDPDFELLTTWELRMVVNGDESDEILAWGREMLRNYRPDHIFNKNQGWRYVSIVGSDVKYGSGDVKFDRPELHKYQNILMNGGVCGRRAFFGRFILRAFGVPTIARPSRGHAALAHWTPQGWVVNLGGGWGCGWTKTLYKNDLDFLATTKARSNPAGFLKVKRAQWIGDVYGEKRVLGESDGEAGLWYGLALAMQQKIIDQSKLETLAALGEDIGEASEPTVAEAVLASPVTDADKQIAYGQDGVITIPAAAYTKPQGNTREVVAMKSFDGGLQVFLPRFFPQGVTVLRGGTWKRDADTCTSGARLKSDGYGRYENWGFRAAVTAGTKTPAEMTIDLGEGVTMEMVYIKHGTFTMGGNSKTDGRFTCVELPKHEVTISRGFYIGKYEVTQAQYEAIKGSNPSRSTKDPSCPVDNVAEGDAIDFCGKLAEKSGLDVRLPTEAEWEYATRAGTDGDWFFGDPSKIEEYAWVKSNSGGKSHPVGQKKPNQWGLYDVYGNVCERIADKYARNYYSISPKVDPTGPAQGTKSQIEYVVNVPKAGVYSMSARVVTVNYDQRLNLAVGEGQAPMEMPLPFIEGSWQESDPVTITLDKGENTLRFWRNKPPQYGMAVKEFTLTPLQ